MCNGDLGMYRVMPWAYPTISGGSSGGSSVDPTPEPAVDPYDFSNAKARFASRSATLVKGDYWTARFNVILTGIKTVDSSAVNFISGDFNTSSISASPSPGSKGSAISFNDKNDLNTTGVAVVTVTYYSDPGSSTCSISGNANLSIKVYDKEGNVIQTKELVVS